MESNVDQDTIDFLYELHRRGLNHLLDSILLSLDRPSLFAAECTCKLWRDIIANEKFWKKILEQQMNTSRRWKQLISARDCRNELMGFLNGQIPKVNRCVYRYLYTVIHLDLEKIERNWENDYIPAKRMDIMSEKHMGVRCMLHNHKYIACAQQNVIGIYTREGTLCELLDGHTEAVTCMDWFENILASGSSDTLVIIWCLVEYKRLATIWYHHGEVRAVVFFRYKLASCAADGTVIISNVIDPLRVEKLITISKFKCEAINCIGFDTKFIVFGGEDTTVQVWSAKSGKSIRTLNGHNLPVTCLHYVYPLIASAGKDCDIRLWNVESGTCICLFEGHDAPILCLKFDDKRLITCSKDGTLKIWDLANALHCFYPSVQCLTDTFIQIGETPCLSMNEFSIIYGSLYTCTITVRDFLHRMTKSYVQIVEDLLNRRFCNFPDNHFRIFTDINNIQRY